MARIVEVKAPRIDVNSETVTIYGIALENGSSVKKDQTIAIAESAKGTMECLAPADGFIYFTINEYDEVNVDSIIALISDEEDSNLLVNYDIERKQIENNEYQLTDKAADLIKKHNIPLDLLPKGKIIREKDILHLIPPSVSISPTKNNQVIVFGGGGHAKMCIEIIKQTNYLQIYGISDSNYPHLQQVLGIEVLGDNTVIEELYNQGYNKMVNGIGAVSNHSLRKEIFLRYKEKGFEFPNLIHPRAIVEPSATMGQGNQIMAGAIIGPSVKIGNNCIVNSGSIVSHDSTISDHVHIAPGAILAGGVTVGENTLIGMGTTIFYGVKIGKNVVINNGCNIYRDIPDGEKVS